MVYDVNQINALTGKVYLIMESVRIVMIIKDNKVKTVNFVTQILVTMKPRSSNKMVLAKHVTHSQDQKMKKLVLKKIVVNQESLWILENAKIVQQVKELQQMDEVVFQISALKDRDYLIMESVMIVIIMKDNKALMVQFVAQILVIMTPRLS